MILYMVMGWLVVVAMYPLLQTLPAWGAFLAGARRLAL